jgi:flagellar biogenesis protein FliO
MTVILAAGTSVASGIVYLHLSIALELTVGLVLMLCWLLLKRFNRQVLCNNCSHLAL